MPLGQGEEQRLKRQEREKTDGERDRKKQVQGLTFPGALVTNYWVSWSDTHNQEASLLTLNADSFV